MRGLTEREHVELRALDAPGERVFDGPIMDALFALERIQEYDVEPDGSCRIEPTELGRIALRPWPANRVG